MPALRMTLAWAYAAAVSILGFCLCVLRPFNPANNSAIAKLYVWGGRPILGVKVIAEGRERLRSDEPRVLIANHQSNDDLFLLGDVLPRRTVVVGKKSLSWIPIFGQMFWLGGNVLIDRKAGRKAKGTIGKTAAAMREDRKSVWIFPEGTRSKGRGLLPFKRGAFLAAIAAQAPILMICVSEYRGRGRQQHPVLIRILEPVPTAGLTEKDLPALIATCHHAMSQTIDELNVRARSAH